MCSQVTVRYFAKIEFGKHVNNSRTFEIIRNGAVLMSTRQSQDAVGRRSWQGTAVLSRADICTQEQRI